MLEFNIEHRAGFEYGATGARMVVMVRRKDGLRVEHVLIEDVPFESRARGSARMPLESARQLLLHRNLAGYKTVFTVPGAVESCFVILPKMGKSETENAMLLQARKLLSWEGENPVVSFSASEFLRDRVGCLIGLGDNKAINLWGRLFEMGGGLVDDVTVAACAFQSLARAQRWSDEFPVVLVADLGAVSSWFYVLDRQSVRFMRKVPVGGDAMTRTLTAVISTKDGPLELTDIEAEEVKITGQFPSEGRKASGAVAGMTSSEDKTEDEAGSVQKASGRIQQMEALVRPVVERISSEILRSIQFYKDNAGQQVNAVFLTGGASSSTVLRDHLKTSIDVPCRAIDPFAGLRFADSGMKKHAEKHSARLAVAAGLALTEQPAISLLPRHVHFIKSFASFIPKAIAVLLILCFLPMLGAGIDRSVKIKLLNNEIERYRLQFEQVLTVQQQFDALQRECAALSSKIRAVNDISGRSPLWPGVLNALADAVPRDVVLTHCGIGVDKRDPDLLFIGGEVLPSAGRFDDAMSSLLSDLGASVFFKHISIINAQAKPSDSALGTFTIQCELVY